MGCVWFNLLRQSWWQGGWILGDSVGKSAVRVLVADDDALNRDFLQRLLTAHGYEVLLAENGQAALRLLLQNGAPQIVLLWFFVKGLG